MAHDIWHAHRRRDYDTINAAEAWTLETSDGRYVKVGDDEWWDKAGVDIVPEHAVDAYMADNPKVGIAVIEGPHENCADTVH